MMTIETRIEHRGRVQGLWSKIQHKDGRLSTRTEDKDCGQGLRTRTEDKD